jgi:hypothetical protein
LEANSLTIMRAILLYVLVTAHLFAQDYRWQQHVSYQMEVRLDVKTHKLLGTQKLVYTNNSRDTLHRVYYHLYYNAFQPGSMMDVRSRTIADPDGRVTDRISRLKDDEIGYQHIISLAQDGKAVQHRVLGTILEVQLNKPLLPGSKTTFNMQFEAQVPVQIRRTGRNNREGIAYSMTQWYPKMAEYDHQGWHAYQYVGREFHGVWGDFDVKITLDPTYIVAGTGVLQNPQQTGYGYEKPGTRVNRPAGELTWHFVAKNVIDFAWAADPDYTHTIAQVPDGPEVHFFYQKNERTAENWKKLEEYVVRHFQFMNSTYGKYPYPVYSVIQGGDGGMEYPMCTLILGEGNLNGLVSTAIHEISHSWYQAVLASNESLYPWMDEGFTSFTQDESLARFTGSENPHAGTYASYFNLVRSGLQEPASQHSDHYTTNRAYTVAAYSMGSMLLNQLRYIMGDKAFHQGMLNYFNAWKFRHPEPNDFIRIMEKTSGMSLSWFMRYWINTTKRIDYGIRQIVAQDNKTFVVLERIGELPMPVELTITLRNGQQELYYIPLNETLGSKSNADYNIPVHIHTPWPWVNPTYTLEINKPLQDILSMEIDARQQTADIDRKNNRVDFAEGFRNYTDPTR